MVMTGNEKERERGLQFLWCITHNCKEAQEKVIAKTELFSIILQAIADADCGRNALRMLLLFFFQIPFTHFFFLLKDYFTIYPSWRGQKESFQ